MRKLHNGLLLSGLVTVAIGVVNYDFQHSLTLPHSAAMLLWAGLLWGVGKLERRMGLPPLVAMLIVMLMASAHFAGPGMLAGTLLLAAAAAGVGSQLVADDAPDALLSLLAGLGLLAGTAAWLLPLPVFTSPVLLTALMMIVLWRRQALGRLLGHSLTLTSAAEQANPTATRASLLVLALAAMPSWLPSVMSDDLSYHLKLPSELVQHGFYRFDVGSQVWSLAPWLGDVLHGLVWVVGQGHSLGALNLLWLACAGLAVFRLGKGAGLADASAWLGSMLYLSLPLTGLLSLGMQSETASAAVAAGLAVAVQSSPDTPTRRQVLLLMVLAGFLLGLKVINATLILPLALWQVWRWRHGLPWRWLPAALAAFFLIAGASYSYAWALADNPLLPLYNGFFQSPWAAPSNFYDTRWGSAALWQLPWQLTFHSNGYLEAKPGAAGVLLIGLLGGLFGAWTAPRARPLLLAGLVAWLLPLSQIQYLRYAHPAMVLLIPALLAGLGYAGGSVWRNRALAGLVILQLFLQPSASWILSGKGLPLLLSQGRDAVAERFAPEYLLAQKAEALLDSDDRILITSPSIPYVGVFAGRAFVANWYDYQNQDLLSKGDDQGSGWERVIATTGANHLLLRDEQQNAPLQAFLARQPHTLIARSGPAQLLRLDNPGTLLAAGSVSSAERTRIVQFAPLPTKPVFAEARVTLRCQQPGKPLAIVWSMPGSDEKGRKALLTCQANGSAQSILKLRANAPLGALQFTVQPVAEQEPPAEIIESHWQLRPDLGAERDLGQVLRNRMCWSRSCRSGIAMRISVSD